MELLKKGSVLVIDDQFSIRTSIHFVLDKEYDVYQADNVKPGLAIIRQHKIDTVILDLSLEGIMGIEGLKMIKELDPTISVIILTGYGSLKTAQEAIRYRADDYIIKPFNTSEMRESVKKSCEFTSREREKERLLARLDEKIKFCELTIATKVASGV